jgi:hypothetical protein
MDNASLPDPAQPVDVTRIVAEVREQLQQHDPGPEPQAQEDRDILALAVRRHLENQEVLGRASVESPAALPAAMDARPADINASGEDAEFERNREQLFHPPLRENPSRVKAAAMLVIILLILLVGYAAYVSGLFNPLLPASLQSPQEFSGQAVD